MIPLPRGEFFVPMEAYLDESGIHDGAHMCAIGGCAGGRQKVKALEEQWLKIMAKFGIPEEEGFHAKDFFYFDRRGRRKGVYAGWGNRKSQDFIESMIATLTDNKIIPFGVGIKTDLFNSLPHNFRRWITGGLYDVPRGKWKTSGAPTKPYFYAFHHALICACRKAKSGVIVDFIFDQQNNFSPLVLGIWKQLQGHPTEVAPHLGGVAFYSRFKRVSLQAADLVAYCTYHVDQYRADAEKDDVRFAISKLLGAGLLVSDLNKAIEPLYSVYPSQLREEDERISKKELS